MLHLMDVSVIPTDLFDIFKQFGPIGLLCLTLVLLARVLGDLVSHVLATKLGRRDAEDKSEANALDAKAFASAIGDVLGAALKPVLDANTAILGKIPILEERIARLSADVRDLEVSHREVQKEQAEARGEKRARGE